MVKVGGKVKIKAVRHGSKLAKVNDVVTVTGPIYNLGFMAVTSDEEEVYVCYDFDNSCADYLAGDVVMTETQSEAERRGAKFGVTGVNKVSGHKITFITDDDKKNCFGEVLWSCLDDVSNSIVGIHPSNIRLEHELEFVAWSEAPEELKYDASRVYWKGEPVKWIAKPEGADLADVVYTTQDGIVGLSSDCLTVKL